MREHRLTHRGVVQAWQCDHMGHLNVMWYVGKFDEGTWNLLASIGLTPAYLRERKRLMVAVDQCITYRRELLAGDLITVESAVLAVGSSSVRFMHRMRNAETGALASLMILTGVHLDATARKSCPLPPAIRSAAESALLDDADRWSGWPLPAALLE
jgi:acyl-CoA thioester hydrolase